MGPAKDLHRKLGERVPLLKKTASSIFETGKYQEVRTWPGFGDADRITFAEGQAVKSKTPFAYNMALRVLMILHFFTGVVYIAWIGEHCLGFGLIIGPMFLIAESLSYIARVVCFSQYATKQQKAICPLGKLNPPFPESEWPIVQFCVTHYREPVAETYPTLKNLIEMDYPMNKLEINILDDGYFNCKDGVYTPHPVGEEMTAMIRALVSRIARGAGSAHEETTYFCPSDRRPEAAPTGSLVIEFKHECMPTVRQICRRRGKESHFKGGNLNNAIFNVLNSDAYQYFAFLDCDMAPTPDFLQLSMPSFFKYANGRWMSNWEVGMTQAPQNFWNLDETNGDDDPLFQKTDVYWRRTMQHLDHWGLVHYYGTNVVMFKPALEDVVGWQYGVLSEDTPTGANLTSLGWKAVYVDQDVATGLVKDTVVDTLSQRKRWAVGNIMWGLLKYRSWLSCLLTETFQNPPYYDTFKAREAAAHAGRPLPIPHQPRARGAGAVSQSSVRREVDIDIAEVDCPEAAIPASASEAEDDSIEPMYNDVGQEVRQRRAKNWLIRTVWNLSYWHVTWSNPINAFWFVSYIATAGYMLIQFLTNDDMVSLNVLYPALHFFTTTTILFVIGPQSTMWRGCQDRFAFAWVRLIAIFDSFQKGMTHVKNAPWNSSATWELMAPPIFIYLLVCGTWFYSLANCALDYEYCFADVDSQSLVSATFPTQVIGLFLGMVILISMWPMFRCSMSNVFGYKMYKFRTCPGGAMIAYLLALAPVLIFGTLFVFYERSIPGSADLSYTPQLCVVTGEGSRVAPSVFVIGCKHCATTSLFQDMSTHFPKLDVGNQLLEGEDSSLEKDKHFFDDEDSYAQGWGWYLSHYSNCSTYEDNGVVGVDFTETYLESGPKTARNIYRDYSQFPSSHNVLAYQKLKFIVLLRDPIERLYSYFVSSKADGSLDTEGVTSVSDDCLKQMANCSDLTFDAWAGDQISRASDCEKANPDEDLWPSCGTKGLFGGLYSQHLKEYVDKFNSSQIAVVPMEAYTNNAPVLLKKLSQWIGVDFDADSMSTASHLASTYNLEAAEKGMSSGMRDTLSKFYDPYNQKLYEKVMEDADMTFLDVFQAKDIF